MKRSNLFASVEVALLVAAAGVAVRLPNGLFVGLDAVWFLAGLIVLAFSDVWLPRGDAIGMSAALVLGAALLFDARVVLALLAIANVLALLTRGREETWRSTLSDTTAKALAAVTCSAVLVPMSLHPAMGLLRRPGIVLEPIQYVYLLLAGVLFAALDFGLVQVSMAARTGRPLRSTVLGGFSYGGWLIAAQTSAGILAAVMYRTMSGWGLAVAVIMILVMRQSFVLLLDIRQAYNSTIDVLIRAMEVQTPGREVAAEHSAALCTSVGRQMGLHGKELERLRYAALLVGIGSTNHLGDGGVDPAKIIEGVEFLRDVRPILDVCDAPDGCPRGRRGDLLCAYVVMAVRHAVEGGCEQQVARLRKRLGSRLLKDVDRAIEAAQRAGQVTRGARGVA